VRPSWSDTLLTVAVAMAERSTCPRAQTGAVITDPDHRVLATGYNGAPRHLPHCTEVGCLVVDGHCVRALHAEENAILQAARAGTALEGAQLHCTHRPCIHCAKLVVQAGITRVEYLHPYETDGVLVDEVLGLLTRSGVEVVDLTTTGRVRV
jgi:dCMP deaminase